MRWHRLVWALVIARSCVAQQSPAEVPDADPIPTIEVLGATLGTTGALQVGEWASHSREVRSNCEWPLQMRVVRTSCPIVEVRLEPEIMLPGELGAARLRAPVTAVAGKQTHFATIEATATNDRGVTVESTRFDVAVSYMADLSLIFKPERLWIAVVKGERIERTVILRSDAMDALNVRGFAVEDEELSVASVRRIPVPAPERPGEEAIVVTLSGTFRATGFRECELKFQTDDLSFASVTIPIQIAVRDFWLAVPAGFPLVIQDDASLIMQEVRLFGRDGSNCPVARIELRDDNGRPAVEPGLSFELIPGDETQHTQVHLECDVSKVDSSEGVRQLALIDGDGNVLRAIPVAWVKTHPQPVP